MVKECKSTESILIVQAGCSNVRLPKLEIKKFNGEYHDWQRHRSIQIELCRRLRNSIIYDHAETAFRGLILNAVNYETALTILNEKYGNSQLLIEEHLKSLQNLPVITNQWDLKRLEKFVSDMEINIRGLETLKTPTVVYQAVLMPLILSRLPREISLEWKRQNPNRQKDMITKSKSVNVSMERKEASFSISIQQDDCSTRTVYYSRIMSYGKKSLPYLQGGSCHGNCPKENNEREETEIILCLRRGPPHSSCKSKVKCRTEECSKRHHPLIHPNQDKPSVSENQPNASAIETAHPHAVYHHEQLEELGRLAPEDPTPVMEIYDEFASNATTSLDTAAYLPTWDQMPHTIYNRRARRYPRLDGWMVKSAGATSYC
ncbi:hypothetical protein T08_2000 [Trichinella sp. T8]|nr:hypothetical protein T08_2000 [Trichinella sp. T8]